MNVGRLSIGALTVLLAGCGGGTDVADLLPMREQRKVAKAQQAITWTAKYFEIEQRFPLTGRDPATTQIRKLRARTRRQARDGVDYLIRLCRKDPDRTYPGEGVPTVREILEESGDTLREARPKLAAKLDRAADNDCR
jgi:hypothetical protein